MISFIPMSVDLGGGRDADAARMRNLEEAGCLDAEDERFNRAKAMPVPCRGWRHDAGCSNTKMSDHTWCNECLKAHNHFKATHTFAEYKAALGIGL